MGNIQRKSQENFEVIIKLFPVEYQKNFMQTSEKFQRITKNLMKILLKFQKKLH